MTASTTVPSEAPTTSAIPATTTTAAATTGSPGQKTFNYALPLNCHFLGRKFDGLSFMGGMILVAGLGALTFLVVRHLRRTNRLPYANLR